jgi:hypothetical protein
MGRSQNEPVATVRFDAAEVAVFVERSDFAMRFHPGGAVLVLASYPERYIYLRAMDRARSRAKIYPIGCNPNLDPNWQENVKAINRDVPLLEEIPTSVLKPHLAKRPRFIEIEFTLSEIRVRGVELQPQKRRTQGVKL